MSRQGRPFIDANADLNKLSNVNGTDPGTGLPVVSPNRFLWTALIPTTTNPVDNQRFFTWQQYADFLLAEPDEGGLNFWTSQITVYHFPDYAGCNTGFNDNNPCTRTQRTGVSKAFFVVNYPTLFTGQPGHESLTNNSLFLKACYAAYLRRNSDDDPAGFLYWKGRLDGYGQPANEAGANALIDAFINDPVNAVEYRRRFGQP